MSVISFIAIAVYLGTCLLCLRAAAAARKNHRPKRDSRIWLICGFSFVALGLIRALSLEEKARDALRSLVRGFDMYDDRAAFQLPLGILAIILGVVILLYLLRRLRPSQGAATSQLLLLAQFATLGFIPLYTVRIVSWHAIDRLLYAGPLRLNWLLDGGLTILTATCAIFYARQCLLSQSKRNRRNG